jgi:hypothetical protein
MNACLQWNAPGIGGPEDQPEYDGPTVEELVLQKMSDPEFLMSATGLIPTNCYEPLAQAEPDLSTFGLRFLFEARKVAEDEAREEYDRERQKFMEENS